LISYSISHSPSSLEFKKLPDDNEKFNAIKTLLKAYQSEIDSLTRRSKSSETAFLHVYKLLAEAPDPYPLLDAAVDQTIKAAQADVFSSEVARLKDENGELKSKIAELGNVEDKRKRAEARADGLEEKMEGLIADRVQQKENELDAKYDERMKNYEQRCGVELD
jgi:homeobox protein cut-like